MSFSIGIYDLFAYTIPGFLYLYVVYEILQKLSATNSGELNLPALPDGYGLFIFVLLLVSAHLLGHLVDPLAHWFVYRLFKPFKFSEIVLPRIKDLHSDVDIQYQPKDWGLLFSMLRLRNQELTRTIDTFEANSIMLRNISLGLFLLGALQVYSLFLNFAPESMAIAIALFVFSLIARKRSHMFHKWFLNGIFESSLRFGNSLKEVLAYDQRDRRTPSETPSKRPTKKPSRKE